MAGRWMIERCPFDNAEELDHLLDRGWEPFAVIELDRSGGNQVVFLRRLMEDE